MEHLGEFITINENAIRVACFVTLLVVMLFAEHLKPARKSISRSLLKHNVDNISLVIMSSLVLRLVPVILATSLALKNEQWQLGLSYSIAPLHNIWLAGPLSIIALDMAIYWQHRAFHVVPVLWRLHQVHHCDRFVTATTALRFHPVEIFLSMTFKGGLVIALGAPVESVVIFEILLNGCAIFNHSNIRLPPAIERRLRNVLITPTMHRVHHATEIKDSNKNYGFSTSIWDALFGTFQKSCKTKNHKLGVNGITNHTDQGIANLLMIPFQTRLRQQSQATPSTSDTARTTRSKKK